MTGTERSSALSGRWEEKASFKHAAATENERGK